MSNPTLMKKLINEVMDMIEDVATAVLGILLLVFALGAWYGAVYKGQPQLLWPAYLFVAVLVLKLLKDLLERGMKKK